MLASSSAAASPFLAPTPKSQRRLLVTAAAGPILLASAYVLTGLLPAAPIWNAAMRVLPAGLMLLAIHPALPSGAWVWRSAILGALNFATFFAAQAFALHRIPGGIVATIAATQAILVPLGASTVLGERLRRSQLVTAAAGVLGIALLVLRGTEDFDTAGITAAALLALCPTIGMLLTHRWGLPTGVPHTTATAWQMLVGAVLLLPLAAVTEGPPPPLTLVEWSVTLWLALAATALAFTVIFGSLHNGLAPNTLSRLMLLCPLAATAAGWILNHQSLTPLQLVGTVLILISVAAACSRPAAPPPPAPKAVQWIAIPAPRQPSHLEQFHVRSTGRHRAGAGRHRLT